MTRKLYVHIGPTKTGTSAIQSALSKHDGSIIIYPKAGQFGPHGSHHNLVQAFFKTDRSSEASERDAENLLREFSSNVSSSKCNVLISSEWIIRKKGKALEFIRHLLSALGDDSWEVEILFGCRDHFERAASTYSQCIKGATSIERRDPDEFLRERVNAFLYSRMTRKILESGLKVTGLNYHPSSSWIERFLSYVGFAENDIPEPEIKNSSLSTKALIAQLSACRTIQHAEERRTFWNALKLMPGFYAPAQFIFGASAAVGAEQSFAADRKYLRDEFGVALPEPDLEKRESKFFVDACDLADISMAARQLGQSADAVLNSAARYLRT